MTVTELSDARRAALIALLEKWRKESVVYQGLSRSTDDGTHQVFSERNDWYARAKAEDANDLDAILARVPEGETVR